MMTHLAFDTQNDHRFTQSNTDRCISYWSFRCSGGEQPQKKVSAQSVKII